MKKLIALISAAALILSLSACGNKTPEEETTVSSDQTTVQSADAPTAEDEKTESTAEGKETSAPDEENEEVSETETNAKGEIVHMVSTPSYYPENKPEKVTKATTIATEKIKDPSGWSTAEVLSYYKTATEKVVSAKPGYKKTRESKLNNYDAGVALNAFKSLVFKFLGVGAENRYEETVVKGSLSASKFQSFNVSKLTAADVKSAKCVKSGSDYIVTININDGSSSISGGSNSKNNSPLDKSVINIGTSDRAEFDHKTAQVVYDAIQGVASGAVINEKTNNIVLTATINASTGNIKKLIVSYRAVANLSKIVGSKATLDATTTVTYSNFGW